jgi:L-threonylcarbamoyladenylate synthase
MSAPFIELTQAVSLLKSGEIVAIPTETVYGLAGVATNPLAIEKIYKAKKRPKDNPLICHVVNWQSMESLGAEIPYFVKVLIDRFSPGPISYLVNLKEKSSLKHATCGLDSVLFRIPDNTLTLELIEAVGAPLAAPSANTSGRFSATTPHMVVDDLGESISGVIDGGQCSVGLESTIIDCRQEDSLKILRPGSIGIEEIQSLVLEKKLPVSFSFLKTSMVTPGAKYKHYAPTTPLVKIHSWKEIDQTKNFALLLSEEKKNQVSKEELSKVPHILLGKESLPSTISKELYHHLFLLDQLDVEIAYILIDLDLEQSLSLALKDRLGKIIIF